MSEILDLCLCVRNNSKNRAAKVKPETSKFHFVVCLYLCKQGSSLLKSDPDLKDLLSTDTRSD